MGLFSRDLAVRVAVCYMPFIQPMDAYPDAGFNVFFAGL